jgi:hypothetical protein
METLDNEEPYPRLKPFRSQVIGGEQPPVSGGLIKESNMLTLKPFSFLNTEPSIRRAIDRLASIKAQRKELEVEEEGIKLRLQEVALQKGEDVLKGDKFEAQIVTEFQERINTPLLKASLRPSDLAQFTKTIKVVKVVVRALSPRVQTQEAAE